MIQPGTTLRNKKTGEIVDVTKIELPRIYVTTWEIEEYGYIADWYILDSELENNYEQL